MTWLFLLFFFQSYEESFNQKLYTEPIVKDSFEEVHRFVEFNDERVAVRDKAYFYKRVNGKLVPWCSKYCDSYYSPARVPDFRSNPDGTFTVVWLANDWSSKKNLYVDFVREVHVQRYYIYYIDTSVPEPWRSWGRTRDFVYPKTVGEFSKFEDTNEN